MVWIPGLSTRETVVGRSGTGIRLIFLMDAHFSSLWGTDWILLYCPPLAADARFGSRQWDTYFFPVNPVFLCILPPTPYAYLHLYTTDLITRINRRSLWTCKATHLLLSRCTG